MNMPNQSAGGIAAARRYNGWLVTLCLAIACLVFSCTADPQSEGTAGNSVQANGDPPAADVDGGALDDTAGGSPDDPVDGDDGAPLAEALAAFSIPDVNPASSRFGEDVSPRDYLGQVSAWYFGHAT